METSDPLTCCSFKNDGATIAVGTRTGEVMLFDTRSKKAIQMWQAHPNESVLSVQFQNSGTHDKPLKLVQQSVYDEYELSLLQEEGEVENAGMPRQGEYLTMFSPVLKAAEKQEEEDDSVFEEAMVLEHVPVVGRPSSIGDLRRETRTRSSMARGMLPTVDYVQEFMAVEEEEEERETPFTRGKSPTPPNSAGPQHVSVRLPASTPLQPRDIESIPVEAVAPGPVIAPPPVVVHTDVRLEQRLQDMKEELLVELQATQAETLRQFFKLRIDMECLILQHGGTKELRDENARLQEENRRLRARLAMLSDTSHQQ
jgi:hypothetical protein